MIFKIFIGLCIAAALGVYLFSQIDYMQRCHDHGGAFVRGGFGFTCIKAEEIP